MTVERNGPSRTIVLHFQNLNGEVGRLFIRPWQQLAMYARFPPPTCEQSRRAGKMCGRVWVGAVVFSGFHVFGRFFKVSLNQLPGGTAEVAPRRSTLVIAVSSVATSLAPTESFSLAKS